MKKVISLILLTLILLISILMSHLPCRPEDYPAIHRQSTYLGYENIPKLTIKMRDSISGILFSDDGHDFLFWTNEGVYIYSLTDTRSILYRKISFDKPFSKFNNDLYYPLFSVSNQIPNSFRNLKNYAEIAKKYSKGKTSYSMVNYNQQIAALNNELCEFYIQINSKERINLYNVKDGGRSHYAMSAFDMNTWWTSRGYPNPNSKFKDKIILRINQYKIWKNRNGKVSSFSITPADLGMKEPDVGHNSCYISPSGKYVFIIYARPENHVSGRFPTFSDFAKCFTNLFKWQKFHIAIIDIDTEKIIKKKKFSSYKNYYPNFTRGFAISEKRKIFACREDEFINFYHLDDI